MVANEQLVECNGWRKFLKEHWQMVVLFVAGAVLASIGAVLVFLWFAGDAQLTGMVPTTLNLWSMGHLVTFILHLLFWEILIIGIPVIIVAAGGWYWWKKLPDREKEEYHFFNSRSRATSGSGGASLLFSIAYCIKVFIDGNWNVAFSTWTFDYLVDSMLWTLIWILIIFGIPIAIAAILWVIREMNKECLSHPQILAKSAAILMSPEYYSDVLEAAESCNRTKFKEICTRAGINSDLVDELWAAAAGTQSAEALAKYPGSAGW